jgi:NAD(P)-dependent dehydrogenase (short-subunit alcohol dehydrogenase family)
MDDDEPGGLLAGKTVLVTGGGRGIGAAYAKLAARSGAAVVVNDIDDGPVYAVVDSIRAAGHVATAHVGDISSWHRAGEAVQTAIEVYGALDGLVNNAGVLSMHRPDQEGEESFRRTIEVNLLGTAFCGMHALRHMTARNRGSIVNVTSGAHAGLPGMAAYGASKGAVASLTYGWAVDVEHTGVRVNAISPLAATRMLLELDAFHDVAAAERGRSWRDSPPAEMNAATVVYLLSDRSAGIHGQIVRVDDETLALVAHPLTLLPTVPGAGSVAGVEEAFETTLKGLLQPLGIHSASVALES